jgi:hypothetical protein
MDDVPKHDIHEAAGRPLRRARFAAWAVFLGMAGTTMAFQTYHSLHYGQMPWPLAYLYGIVPLGISIGVLMFAAVWPSRWAQGGAYAITAGAMYMSASATGAVTLHAAAPHAELLFGFLLDGAALLAVRFIFDGPTAGQAVAEVARREAELTGAATAAREDLGRAVTEHRKAAAETEAGHAAEKERLERKLAAAGEATETWQAEAARVHQMTVSVLEERERVALAEAEAASARAERLERKLAAATGSGKGGSGTRKPAAATAPERPEATAVNPDDLPGDWGDWDTEARVLFLVNEKGFSASKAGVEAGVTDARGRQIARMAKDLGATAPQDVVGEVPES